MRLARASEIHIPQILPRTLQLVTVPERSKRPGSTLSLGLLRSSIDQAQLTCCEPTNTPSHSLLPRALSYHRYTLATEKAGTEKGRGSSWPSFLPQLSPESQRGYSNPHPYLRLRFSFTHLPAFPKESCSALCPRLPQVLLSVLHPEGRPYLPSHSSPRWAWLTAWAWPTSFQETTGDGSLTNGMWN